MEQTGHFDSPPMFCRQISVVDGVTAAAAFLLHVLPPLDISINESSSLSYQKIKKMIKGSSITDVTFLVDGGEQEFCDDSTKA